ncbi:MAG: hypothetical protein AB3N28_00820, partial [Kordiimonas sp.]
KMQTTLTGLIVGWLLFLPVKAEQEESISIVGTSIPGMFEASADHYYNKVYDKLISGYSGSVTLHMAHIKRAGRIFSTGDADCLFVASPVPEQYNEFGLAAEDMAFSDAVNIIKIKAFSTKGSPPVTSLEGLPTDMLAFDAGIGDFAPVIKSLPNQSVTILHAPTLKLGFKMLDLGRVNVLLAVDVDVENLKVSEPTYGEYSVSEDFNVLESEDVFVCKKSERVEGFLEAINAGIDDLVSNKK